MLILNMAKLKQCAGFRLLECPQCGSLSYGWTQNLQPCAGQTFYLEKEALAFRGWAKTTWEKADEVYPGQYK